MNKKMVIRHILAAAVLAVGMPARSETLSFAEIWQKVNALSAAQEGARLKSEAIDEARVRAGRHWLPRLYVDARVYRSDDPGAAFVGLLEQRKVESRDFVPDTLNHPDAQTFARGALGIDLALYEGGMKQAQVDMCDHAAKAETLAGSQIKIELYSQAALAYGSIASIHSRKTQLQSLASELARLMKGYQLGQKTNPVGYSGLLGMRSLANRVAGLIDQLEAQEKSYFISLTEMGVRVPNWSPQEAEVSKFTDRYFPESSWNATASYRSSAEAEGVRASEEASKMELARNRPRLGAFAESFLFNGSRDTAGGLTAGLYLQWSLYDPANHGVYREAHLKAQAAERFHRATLQQENAERAALIENAKSLRSNLARLESSEKLLEEQTQVSLTLFRNGSIGALQFVEILNRRTDLIAQRSEAELAFLKTTIGIAAKTKFEIPAALSGGDKT